MPYGREPVEGLKQPQMRLVAAVAGALLGALLLTIPFADLRTTGTEIILPAYAAAIFVLEIITSALLFTLYNVQRSPSLLILASGYLFAALMVPGWAVTVPGLFASLGLETNLQATATIAALRRLAFALFVLGYALAPANTVTSSPPGPAIVQSIICVLAAAAAIMWLIAEDIVPLPVFMEDAHHVTALWSFVPGTVMVIYLLNIAILIRRHRSSLDIWVCLVLFSLVIELTLLSYISSGVRFTIGWWAGRVYGLTAAGIVLLVLLAETTTVYAKLARSVAAEQRARQNRLTAMEALSASIAHEINQPLASIVTNADAGLRWLARAEPRIDKVHTSLQAIVSDGHRANKIVAGIRAMFMKGAQERVPVDLADIIRDVTAAVVAEADLAGISVEVELDPRTPIVIGNPVQLRQVVWNLVENSLDAMRSSKGQQRKLSIKARPADDDEAEVLIQDTGIGLEPGTEERIFEPFFSRKPGGMGMGLMFCRAVIEAHGGRLWASSNVPRGAEFHFLLPGAAMNEQDRGR